MNDILMPLLRTVREHQEEAISKENDNTSEDLGRTTGGERIKMVVHHTRDTKEKQWHETSVIVLRGITRIVRQFLASWISSASLTLDNNVSSPFIHKIKKRNSLVSPKTGGLGSWFFSTKEDEDDKARRERPRKLSRVVGY